MRNVKIHQNLDEFDGFGILVNNFSSAMKKYDEMIELFSITHLNLFQNF